MSKIVEVTLPEQLIADVKPILLQRKLNLDKYILEAIQWYTTYRGQSKLDITDESQNNLLSQIREELAPYTVAALQTALGDDEVDWEALLA